MLKLFVSGNINRKTVLEYLGLGFFVALVILLLLSFSRKGIYSNSLGLNMVVVADDGIALALVRPKEDYLVWIKLPLAMQVKVDSSTAVYPVRTFWKYAEGEKASLDLVSRSLSDTLGVVLPSAIKVSGSVSPENLLGSLHSFALNTNLTVRDRIMLRRDLVNLVSTRKTLEVDIPKTALTKKADPDGVEFFEVNSIVNLWTRNRFVFETLLGESPSISVYNLSGVAGRGMLFSKQLESAGARVVAVESKFDGELVSGRGCLFSSSVDSVYTVYLLEKFLKCKNVTEKRTKVEEGIVVWML